ncbi:MAG: nucleotide exchange factor GrpE [Parasporobacterium sp.]|nr:nucleotide exchange factor GrpE [Parasporobacterium sp.]
MPETDPETMTANSAQAEDATEAEDMTEKDAGQAKAQGSPENAPEAEEAEGNGEPDSESPEEQPAKKERKLKWAKPDPLEEKIKEANDKYARLFAEFDNFRKRTEKEKSQRYDFGVRDIVEKILPVIDNFERGLAAVPEEKAEDSFVTGMQMTYKQLMKTLEDAGVKPIEAVGQEFNPDFHNAVMHVEDPEAGTNIIVEEFQKGYIYKDHVVRYSMVKVAN